MSPLSSSPALSILPGLNSNIMACKVHWNEYLNQWIMVWQPFGSKDVKICASTDGIHWGASATLFTGDTAYAYAQIVGTSDVWAGQDALLVYAQSSTNPADHMHDMCERWVHFGPLTAPQTPTTLTASSSTQATQISLQWKGVLQAQSYEILRATSAAGPFTVIGSASSSASYPTYLDTQVRPQVPYYYAVRAKNTAGTSTTSNQASATATYFRIFNRHSLLPLDVSGGSTTAGAFLVQANDSSNISQEWKIVNLDGTYFQFVNKNSGLVADVTGASTANGAKVVQWTNYSGTNQQWQMLKAGNYYEFVNRNSGKIMDLTGASLTPGTNVIQWQNNHAANQQWQVVPSP